MPLKAMIPILLLLAVSASAATLLPGFTRSPHFHEQVRMERLASGIRLLTNLPQVMRADRPTLVVFYATPNGNTIEQTMGSGMTADLDWHFDIQHVAAQVRALRSLDRGRNVALVCMEAEGLSWPLWRSRHDGNAEIIRRTMERVVGELPGTSVTAVVTGHSGGGSMLWGLLNSSDAVPSWVERIACLDSNYSYSDDDRHGEKLLAWLRGGTDRRLVVIAYDDREIAIEGKKVVGSTGGTWRASHRMIERFRKDVEVRESTDGDFDVFRASLTNHDACIVFLLHRNPANRILHTRLVGEMNGLLHAITIGTAHEGKWGSFGGPRAYTRWVQADPLSADAVPPRLRTARGGTAVMESVAAMGLDERESALLREIRRGNVPDFMRRWATIRVRAKDAEGRERVVVYQVTPDYLSVGADDDFVRVPLTPMAAQAVADAFGSTLPTRKMVDEIYQASSVKLDPQPLGEPRTTVETFIRHNALIEGRRAGNALGELVGGIKKDVVITRLPADRTDHVAIYGWHKLDGSPIQPLTSIHVNSYVDYSHGIRLVKRTVLVDGNPRDMREVLADPLLHPLLSDEGVIERAYYLGEKHPAGK